MYSIVVKAFFSNAEVPGLFPHFGTKCEAYLWCPQQPYFWNIVKERLNHTHSFLNTTQKMDLIKCV